MTSFGNLGIIDTGERSIFMLIKKKLLLVTGVTALFIIIGLWAGFYFSEYNQQKRNDLKQISSQEYNAIFCSMYSIENFAQEDFVTYRGLDTLKLENTLRNTSDLGKYLQEAFASGNTLECIYLGLDPTQIWSTSRKNTDKWNASISEDILAHASAHPEVTFEVLLPAPSLEYWRSKSPEEVDEILTTYRSLVSSLSAQGNIITYFMGGEEWLIANPGNYCDATLTNELVSQKMFLFTFCDHSYQINVETAPVQLDALKSYILAEQVSPTEYPDLSSWDVVFFGDSIIGNYEGSFSIPGAVAGLSGANAYNCAKGGIPASVDPNCDLSCPASAEYFITQNLTSIPEACPFPASMEAYMQKDHTGRNLCFVLNFGLNDYFGGHPVANPDNPYDNTTYAGALREGISKLQSTYPDALIIVMAPTFTIHFSNGTEKQSEKGGILTEYVDAALQVADEMNVIGMNNYTDLGINADTVWTYLADGCHPNETGRFLMAERIIEQISTH